MSFSLISSSTSGVRSLPVKPVPPVVMMTSTSLLEHQSSKIFLITCLSSKEEEKIKNFVENDLLPYCHERTYFCSNLGGQPEKLEQSEQ